MTAPGLRSFTLLTLPRERSTSLIGVPAVRFNVAYHGSMPFFTLRTKMSLLTRGRGVDLHTLRRVEALSDGLGSPVAVQESESILVVFLIVVVVVVVVVVIVVRR